MANGILCKNCGHQESSHIMKDMADPLHRLPGYKSSLEDCRLFEAEFLSPDISRTDLAVMEKEAERRFAFGYFAAQLRDLEFRRCLASFPNTVEGMNEKRKFVEKCRSSNGGFYVG